MKKIFLVTLLIISTMTFSAEKRHMILAGSAGSLSYFDFGTEYKSATSAMSGYYYSLNSTFQVGAQGSLYLFDGLSEGAYSVSPGLIINHPLKQGDTLSNALFLQINLGEQGTIGVHPSSSHFYYSFGFGKRFEIFPNVSYTPNLSIMKIPAFTTGPSYTFKFLEFAVLF